MSGKNRLGSSKASEERFRKEQQEKLRQWEEATGLRAGAVRQVARGSAGYDSLGELLGSGEFRSLVYRPEGGGGLWTIKAVLEMPTSAAGVYMHGAVKNASDLPDVILRCLQAGRWHADKYWRP